MTLIAGWKNKSSVFIAADSAITYPSSRGREINELTSFGEATINEGIEVQDTALKVEVIQDKLIVASAAVDYKCRNFAKDIWRKLESSNLDTRTLIQETFDESDDLSDCSFIFGLIQENEPCLLSYNDQEQGNLEIREVESFTYAGSIEEEVIEIIKYTSGFAKDVNFSDSKTMVSLCAILQSFIMRHPQMQNGIGGLFAGAYINGSGVKWLSNTTYIIYDKRFPEEHSGINISVALRDNGVFIYTPQTGTDNKIFINTHSDNPKEEYQNWYNLHYKKTNKKLNESDSMYIAFLHSMRPIVGILASDFEEYVSVKLVSELKKDLRFSHSRVCT